MTRTVLIVEDSPRDAAIFAELVQQLGLVSIATQSCEEARQALAKAAPDAVILDVVLPEESGYELCRFLRKRPETQGIPILMCSQKFSEMDRFWGMKQGASAYLTKPLDQQHFMRTLRQFLPEA